MKNQNINFEIFNEISEKEFSELDSIIKAYTINSPEQAEIDNTIEMLRQYVSEVKHPEAISDGKLYDIVFNALREIKFMSKYFWFISFIIFLTGFYIVQTDIDINIWYKPYKMILLMAPIPFFLGIVEIYKGRDQGVLELELSCKISERDIILSKLLVISIYNIVLNTVLSVMLSSFNVGVDIFRAAFLWITPFTVVCGLALALSSKMRGGYAATVLVSSWMVFIISVLSQRHIIEKLVTINLWAYVLLSALGILFTGYQVKLTLTEFQKESALHM